MLEVCFDVTHLHHVTMATLHQQELTKGEKEREQGESTMCWHVAQEQSSEIKRQGKNASWNANKKNVTLDYK